MDTSVVGTAVTTGVLLSVLRYDAVTEFLKPASSVKTGDLLLLPTPDTKAWVQPTRAVKMNRKNFMV